MVSITHHGAVQGVTGSCHQMTLASGEALLVDCGMFQGAESVGRELGERQIDFPLDDIKALVVTHCHIDHVGRIPFLLAAGFDGPIYATEATARLLPLVIEDAIKVGVSRDKNLITKVLQRLQQLLRPIPYDAWFSVEGLPQTRGRFRVAGHIMGSAYVEFDAQGERVLFSGDLGAPYAPLLPAPKPPYKADVVVIESTYGDKLHEGRRTRRKLLKSIIERCLKDRGTVLIPAFSIGRTQELLYEIEEIIHRAARKNQKNDLSRKGSPWETIDVIVDSPLAAKFTQHYRDLRHLWDAEARKKLASGRHPLSFEQLITIESHGDHLKLVQHLKSSGRPSIVIAASGMCAGGRIMNYLKALLPDSRTEVLFVGYQAQGTPGRDIQTYGPRGGYVFLDNERIDIRAGVFTISGYSAHADQANLVNFIKRIYRKPKEIRVVHGDDEAKEALVKKLQSVVPDAHVWIPNG
ncbi:MBL fold metallo-hydrolase [Neptunomonas qingdaonensis]|uniref:Metallo-beta-lactamase family protein n=1 Tax=Neptunomonas qingdaonensis TaxID=1045558 RepID=A0A1I2VS14_9GAMM|nr:MBL fold metallo-hydrolase [Neptunomonas qingdaonensis]SFG91962.1 metallo-beta-lactamase family protein [Neptunomonas qingdaonensis]